LEVSAASTTPEKRRIFPDAGSETVTVLIARTVSTGGGGGSLHAVNAEKRATSGSTRVCCEERDIGMILILLLILRRQRQATYFR
jgi:hypothetical protein